MKRVWFLCLIVIFLLLSIQVAATRQVTDVPVMGQIKINVYMINPLVWVILLPLILLLHLALFFWVAVDSRKKRVENRALWMALTLFFGLSAFFLYLYFRPDGIFLIRDNIIHCRQKIHINR